MTPHCVGSTTARRSSPEAVVPYERRALWAGVLRSVATTWCAAARPYRLDRDFISAAERAELEEITLTINAFFGWDFNSCEALLKGGVWYPIDFANACPDSQVTSLHYHFPWLLKANLRWSLFCAATRRKVRRNLDWEPYFAIAARDLPPRDKLRAYAALARTHFDLERFEEFCARHLAHLDDVAMSSSAARRRAVQKGHRAFPHEVDSFIELFGRIQQWRANEGRAA
jgi:hypothetical protein